MPARDLPPLSEAQLEILNAVWDRGSATVGENWKALSARRPVARTTIATLIARLEEKGWLRRREEGGMLWYSAAYPREKVLPGMVQRLVDGAFQGSAEGLVLTLLEAGRLSPGEVERIKAILQKVETKPRKEKP